MLRLLIGLLLTLNIGLMTGAQSAPEAHIGQFSAEEMRLSTVQDAFEVKNFQRVRTALDSSPFKIGLILWSCVPPECGDESPGVEVSGPGLTDAATIERGLIAAGFNPATTHAQVIPAPIFSAASTLPWPLKGEVVPPGMVSAMKPLTIRVRLTSQTFFPATVFSGPCSLDAVVLDEQRHVATWLGQILCPAVSVQTPLLAWGTSELESHLDLNRFNPRFPLAPGQYTLRVQVKRVSVSLGFFGDALYGLNPSDWAVTLPDVAFEIIP
ncbi:hypothetical protein [Deinococcus sp.]|uniref:hypothetical protein n=1 Tax=Deinococcus sp. TaxID=47478 RepID=UPI003C7AD33F